METGNRRRESLLTDSVPAATYTRQGQPEMLGMTFPDTEAELIKIHPNPHLASPCISGIEGRSHLRTSAASWV